MTLSLLQQHPAAQQGLSTFLVPSPLTDSGLLTGKASFHFLIARKGNFSPNSQMWWNASFHLIFNPGELQPDIIIVASSLLSGIVHLSPSWTLRLSSDDLGLRFYKGTRLYFFLTICLVGGATYLQLPTGLPTVLPNGLILATTKPKGSHKSYSEKRRCHEEPKISFWKRGRGVVNKIYHL